MKLIFDWMALLTSRIVGFDLNISLRRFERSLELLKINVLCDHLLKVSNNYNSFKMKREMQLLWMARDFCNRKWMKMIWMKCSFNKITSLCWVRYRLTVNRHVKKMLLHLHLTTKGNCLLIHANSWYNQPKLESGKSTSSSLTMKELGSFWSPK